MTKIKINYKIRKIKNIKRDLNNTFKKKVVALAMKILPKKEKEKYFLKSIDKKLTTYYNNYCR